MQERHLLAIDSAGKLTAALAGAQALVASSFWESIFWADLTGCSTAPSITLAFLAAFGIPAEVPDTNPLQALHLLSG